MLLLILRKWLQILKLDMIILLYRDVGLLRDQINFNCRGQFWHFGIWQPFFCIGIWQLLDLMFKWLHMEESLTGLSRFFHYLDRYFITRRSLPALKEVGLTCFRDLVYQELHGKVRDAVIALIDQEREGEQIDRCLLKNILDIFVEIGMGQMEYYENDFEAFMLKDTSAYYSRKACNWILQDSCPDYMLKAEECLKREKDRVSHYLHFSSEPKLLEKVQNELLSIYATQLLEKEHSGCHALLRDDKVDDLSRMFRLFSKIPHGLDPDSTMFKQHVCAEGTALVKQAEDAASNKKVFVRKVIELHNKKRESKEKGFPRMIRREISRFKGMT